MFPHSDVVLIGNNQGDWSLRLSVDAIFDWMICLQAAESLADPDEFPNLFPDLEFALQAETMCSQRDLSSIAAGRFLEFENYTSVDLIQVTVNSTQSTWTCYCSVVINAVNM